MAQRNTYFQDEIIEKKLDIKQFGRVIRYIFPYKNIFILVGFLMLISAAVSMMAPLLLRYIINHTVIAKEYGELVLIVAGFLVLAAIEIGITFAHQRLMGRTGHNIIAKIRKDIFYKLQQLSFDYFDSRPDGKIVVRATDYINDLANFFTNNLLLFLIYIVKIVVVTIFMLAISPQLTAIVFGSVIPMMICVFGLRYSIRKLFAYHRARLSNRTAFLVESIMGEKIVKNYNRIDMNEKIYMEVHDISARTWMQIVMRNELNTPTVEIFWNLGTLCLYGTALYLILQGNSNIDAGTIVAFISYMSLFSGPLTQVAIIIQQLAQVSSNLEQVFDTIDYPVEIESKYSGIELRNVKGQVDFDDVTFAYEDGVDVLKNFNLHVKPGETIALVGPTGAGKTTVINTITRFYDVNKGSVKIDGIDVREVTLDSLRREVGVLMQDPFIFKGTVIDNIRYGRPDATDEECIKAAKTIFADRCIDKMKDGFYQELEERGAGLSAGEKQLISFARIILKNPSVIILDEATSSIDTETENLIKEAMDVILKDKTAFIVAHRLSTIRNADRILYIDNNTIAEEGTHEELMKLKGLYYSLN
ncbi:ABC transporter ATP-binding protein [Clostridium beijerinckii]|uniref:Putative ABC transporter ATP-binding protein n=1 Tax=Clostridium beijerinckii TaxID=1520 RepID=A0A1S8SDL4_CLOBE|nr:ABC transporter ATP-binding protein [Clostridium beijerinckii]NRY60458.1 ATP-binding cassette subfamily B protein [Clostridium beijerinckii]OOM63527.1 putative ABC transporter ATP-binding protein [Clostridium beijerinckii]